MEILDLRHFSSTDLRPLLEEEIRVWAKELIWDYRGSAEMVLRYVDARILPGYVAVDNGAPLGYAFFVYEGSKGIVGDLYVGAAGRSRKNGRNVESKLLTHVIETLQQSPGIHRVEAQLLLHPSGTIGAPFLREGFRRFPRIFMTLPLGNGNGRRGAPKPLPEELEIRRWSEQDFQAAAAVITAAYRDHVDSELNDQYRTVSGSMRFLNNVVRFPGCGTFDAEASLVAVNRTTRTVVGVLLCSRIREDVGHVTQVCVLPEERGRGTGEALLAHCRQILRTNKFSTLSLTVTEANQRAVALYGRLGFTQRHVFDGFVWEG
jgi:ribosomal protein S18 acetylase RimI-like enzyme